MALLCKGRQDQEAKIHAITLFIRSRSDKKQWRVQEAFEGKAKMIFNAEGRCSG